MLNQYRVIIPLLKISCRKFTPTNYHDLLSKATRHITLLFLHEHTFYRIQHENSIFKIEENRKINLFIRIIFDVIKFCMFQNPKDDVQKSFDSR